MKAVNLSAFMAYFPIILLVLGILLLIAEIYIPSFGITGVLGIILTLAGIALVADTVVEGIIILLIIALALTVIVFVSLKWIIKKNKSLVLKESLKEDNRVYEDLKYFINKEGITVTALRPSGNVDFDGVKLQVLSNGEFIKKDVPVKVVDIQGTRILVKETKPSA